MSNPLERATIGWRSSSEVVSVVCDSKVFFGSSTKDVSYCQPWQKSSWSLPPGLSAPIEPPTGLASFTSRNATLIPEVRNFKS
ncbi:hypothetical protein GCK32_022141 [Trichostrongylus colubriformis]|uniref:Uncharacterized protein n=1 Tax=Trichostrongylus colubriformis TaxID=6319 RepID=A0AAN8FK35_TRICO